MVKLIRMTQPHFIVTNKTINMKHRNRKQKALCLFLIFLKNFPFKYQMLVYNFYDRAAISVEQ